MPVDSTEQHLTQVYALLALYARLSEHVESDSLLEAALDAAIELTKAERGFLLVGSTNNFKVACSRDIDGEPIRKAALKVSRTVAQTVIDTGAPVVTVNAQKDERFESASSVHAMELISIMCLPIKARDQVIGVLYLDHRFRPGVFETPLPAMATAFADLLAVALVHISARRDLLLRNRELAAARAEVEVLLAEKSAVADALRVRCDGLTSDLEVHRRNTPLRYRYEEIIGSTPAMMRVLQQVDRLVDSEIPVLVTGESGTGKELIARAIHFNGPRGERSLVTVNCGALTDTLLESELFGHKRGAFTGANRDHSGLFVAADGGTLFLDEVGELTAPAQVKLLRVLQEGRVRPVGGTSERTVDVRVLAATNQDLTQMVKVGTFRQDLYYRLASLVIRIPPLCDRRDDVPSLVSHILARIGGDPAPSVDPEAMSLIYTYDWPGNVRQLENVLRAAVAICRDERVRADDIVMILESQGESILEETRSRPGPRPRADRESVRRALEGVDGDRAKAAEALGVSLRSLYRYMARWGLS